MDSFEITKVVGAVCGSLLIFLLVQSGAGAIIGGGGHHGDDHHQSYTVLFEEDTEEMEVAEDEPEIDFAALYAAADAGAGERLFRACAACHGLEDGANGVGPHLYNIVGRDIGAAGGFDYSDALAGMGEVWTPENLSGFIEAPSSWAPGTKMSYRGMRDVEDRANLIAYLESIGG
ncbi:MAG: cytochrome c family protein [Pseudomonadota bacterium]